MRNINPDANFLRHRSSGYHLRFLCSGQVNISRYKKHHIQHKNHYEGTCYSFTGFLIYISLENVIFNISKNKTLYSLKVIHQIVYEMMLNRSGLSLLKERMLHRNNYMPLVSYFGLCRDSESGNAILRKHSCPCQEKYKVRSRI